MVQGQSGNTHTHTHTQLQAGMKATRGFRFSLWNHRDPGSQSAGAGGCATLEGLEASEHPCSHL